MDYKSFYEVLWKEEVEEWIGDDYESYANRHQGKAKLELLESGIERIPERGSLLEVGCGSGRIIDYFMRKYGFERGYGFDISEKAIEVGRAHHPNIEFQLLNIDEGKLPFENGAIDIVILCDIVEHVKDYDHLLREAIRVSRHVVIKVPLEGTLSEYIRTLIGRGTSFNRRHIKGHLHPFTFRLFRKYFQNLEPELGITVKLIQADGNELEWRSRILRWIASGLRGTSLNKYIFPTELGVHIDCGRAKA